MERVVTCCMLSTTYEHFELVQHKNKSCVWSRSREMDTYIVYVFESFLSRLAAMLWSHESGRVCCVSDGVSWSKLPVAGAGKSQYSPNSADTDILLEPQGAVTQTLTLPGVFITWCWKCPFLGECRQDLRHFYECWTCLGNGSALGLTLKRPYATLARLVGRMTNT